jgi:hypothetical protein
MIIFLVKNTNNQINNNNINNNQINVLENQTPNFYIVFIKRYFEDHQSVELHATGINATSISNIAADKLVNDGYAKYKELKSEIIPVQVGNEVK